MDIRHHLAGTCLEVGSAGGGLGGGGGEGGFVVEGVEVAAGVFEGLDPAFGLPRREEGQHANAAWRVGKKDQGEGGGAGWRG